ncbi:MAG: hypothetical protein LBR12_00775, partial [Opitutaceae bacterium]|nr:hypothetical protein [Opitutaceae bacterium]
MKAAFPADYFEAKLRRPVRLAEFRDALVPSDTPASARAVLERNGIKAHDYDAGKPGDWERALNEVGTAAGAFFSLSGRRPKIKPFRIPRDPASM